MGTVVEEADETVFWLEFLEESAVAASALVQPLKDESNELLRIFSSSLKTARTNKNHPRGHNSLTP